MVEAICREITACPSRPPLSLRQQAEEETEPMEAKTELEVISTVYFGGGTPSILSIDDLQQIFGALHNRFVFAEDIEITLEANPDDITDEKLAEWKSLGVNRLSVGIQSFLEEELIWMNRAHSAAESLICIDMIQAAGFTNFSVDLIYGSPILSDADWKRNVDLLIEKNIPHISCYALTVEPKTALDKMIEQHKKEPVDAEKQSRQFLLLMDWMEAAGYEHYEISNFAKPGLQSRHNSSYWNGEKYYGFGPAAHSYFPFLPGESPQEGDSPGRKASSRQWNVANNSLYIQSLKKDIIPFEEELLTETQQLNEYIMTSLRTIEGLDLNYVDKNFGEKFSDKLLSASRKYESTGKIKIENRQIILTREGKLFADGIAAELFF